jgi:hypothetical protein
MQLNAHIKKWFFDRRRVIQMVDRDTLRFLRNAGGFGRRVARNSQKRKGKARKPPKNGNGKAYAKWQAEMLSQPASAPGTPPNVHSDDSVRTFKNILFAFDSNAKSVTVGVVLLQRKRSGISLPGLMERGGEQKIREKMVSFTDEEIVDGPAGRDSKGKFTKAPRRIVKGRRWVPMGSGKARPGQPVRMRNAKYPARPIMAPAREKTIKKFPKLWFSEVA